MASCVMAGWITLHRKIQNHWLWDFKHPEKYMAWCDLLMMANHEDKKFMINNSLIECKRGQLALSQLTLSSRWKWGRQKVRTFLEMLKNDSMIDIKTNQHTTIITICNYSLYQDMQPTKQPTDNQPITNAQPTLNQPITTTKQYKQLNNENNVNKKDIVRAETKKVDNKIGFDEFYAQYPKKVKRQDAVKAWAKLTDTERELAINNVIIRNSSPQAYIWTDVKYIPNPASYLNGKRWTDEPVVCNTHVNTRQERNESILFSLMQSKTFGEVDNLQLIGG
jgi:hypothetical protein